MGLKGLGASLLPDMVCPPPVPPPGVVAAARSDEYCWKPDGPTGANKEK